MGKIMKENIEGLTLDVLIKQQHFINLIKRVDSVEGAISVCKDLKIDISDIKFHPDDSPSIQAFGRLQIIAKALNEGWKPNWNDADEYKYYPWFRYEGRSFVFSAVTASYCRTHAGGGSRLCLKTSALAEYMGKQFIELYKDYLF